MTHYPAGHVSPAAFENSQRNQLRLQILAEREQQAKADLEAEIDRRMEAIRGPQEKPVAVQEKPRLSRSWAMALRTLLPSSSTQMRPRYGVAFCMPGGFSHDQDPRLRPSAGRSPAHGHYRKIMREV
jgi:hypothetical protein